MKNDVEIGIGNRNTFDQQQPQQQFLGIARRL